MSQLNCVREDKLASIIVIEEIQADIKALKVEVDELLSNRDETFPLQINTVLDHLRQAETAAQDPDRADDAWQALVQARIALRDSGSRPVIELDGSNLADAISPLVFTGPSSIAANHAGAALQPNRPSPLSPSMVRFAAGFSPNSSRALLHRTVRKLLKPHGVIGKLKIGL
jgi:hypothetical protein